MIYILKILSKNNSKIRLSFYLPWIGIFIGTVFLLLINSIMDGMENEIFTNLNKIDRGYKVTSSSIEELDKIQSYLDINNIHYSEQLLRDVVVASDQNYLIAKLIINGSLGNNKNISIGYGISKKLGLSQGDSLQIFSPLDVKLTTMQAPNKSFLINTVYEVPVIDFDEIFIFSNDTLFANQLESEKYFLLDQNINRESLIKLNELFSSIKIQEWIDEYSPLINAIKLEKTMYNSFGYLLIIISSLGLFTTTNYTISNKIKSLSIIDLMGYNFTRIRFDTYKLMAILCCLSTIFAIFCTYLSIYLNLFDPLIEILFPKDLFYDFNLSIKLSDCMKILIVNTIVIIFSIFIPLKTIDSCVK